MSIVGYWRMNGNSNDASGNGRNCIDTDISYSQNNGKLNQGAGFNGTSSKILYTGSNFGIDGGRITISMWVRLDSSFSSTGYFPYFYVRSSNTRTSYAISYNNSHVVVFDRTKAAVLQQDVRYTLDLRRSKMTHLTLTYDLTNLKAYIDGKFIGQIAASGNGSGTAFTNGCSFSYYITGAGTGMMKGSIDETKLDDSDWSPAKIKNENSSILGFF